MAAAAAGLVLQQTRRPPPFSPPWHPAQFEEIRAALRFAGDLARTYGQRLTFHPSCAPRPAAPRCAALCRVARHSAAAFNR